MFKTPNQTTIDVHARAEDGRETVVRTTPVHPFWVSGKRWTEAANLRVGDELWSNGDERWTVTRTNEVAGREDVYNLEVEGAHTYFAGDERLWVHNSDDCISKADQLRANAAQGAKAEQNEAAKLANTQSTVQPQITVKNAAGRTRMDFTGKDIATDETALTEVKSGGAKLNPNQARVHAEIANSGGVVAGKEKPGFEGGTILPPRRCLGTHVPRCLRRQ